jgi:phage gp29-like protein
MLVMQTDKNGTTFRVREKQKQTDNSPRIIQLRREFAEHPSRGLTPLSLAAIMTEAEQGNLLAQCYLAEDVEEKDGHIYAELFKRRMALTSVPFRVEPPRNASAQEKKDAANYNDVLADIPNFEDVLFNMADGILKGFSNLEFHWERYLDFRLPTDFQHRPATWFQLSLTNQDQLMLRNGTAEGEPLAQFGWIQHRHAAKSGYVARSGLIRQLAWPFIFKNYSVRDLAEFLEIYGIPIRIGKYPAGANDDEKNRLLQAVWSVGHNSAGIMPKGMEMEFVEAAKGGGEPFMTMMSWCERIQSKVILGQTLTAQVDSSGSQALGNVHNEVRLDIRNHDLRQLASTLNRDLIWPMHMLNGKSYNGDPRRLPQIKFDIEEPEDIKLFSESLPALVGMGMKIPSAWAHQKLAIPQQENDEPILGLTTAQPAPASKDKTAALRLAIASLKAEVPEQDLPDQFAAQLRAKAAPVMQKMLTPVEDLVANATSLEELLQQLLQLEGKLDESELAELIHLALSTAELSGRFDVSAGN